MTANASGSHVKTVGFSPRNADPTPVGSPSFHNTHLAQDAAGSTVRPGLHSTRSNRTPVPARSLRVDGTQHPELTDLGTVFHQFGVAPPDHVGDDVLGVLPRERRQRVAASIGLLRR